MAEYYYDYQKDEVMVDTDTAALIRQKQQADYLQQKINTAQAQMGGIAQGAIGLSDNHLNPIMLRALRTFDCVLEILRRKNSDYASTADPFLNFRSAERIGLSVQQGIMMRLMDKMSRLENLVGKGAIPEVSDESVVDTCHDMIGYLVCLLASRSVDQHDVPASPWIPDTAKQTLCVTCHYHPVSKDGSMCHPCLVACRYGSASMDR